uniref:Peptidase S1 domain-containing protein n=1 Tax=Anopheles christyi TaxID=43041 RepID=A0A182KAR1_9DIPT
MSVRLSQTPGNLERGHTNATMTLPKRIAVLSVLLAIVRGQEPFTDTVPDGFYLRKDLSDCLERFHAPKLNDYQCLVFGGTQVNVTEFPHMAVLGWKVPEEPDQGDGGVRWQCGGSLITVKYVLTAAHCAADADNIPPRFVRLGDVNLASAKDDTFAQQFEIKSIVRHPEHRFSKKYFNLALVELDGVVRLTGGVCPTCLWTNSKVLPADFFQTAGFGETSLGSGSVPTLLKTSLRATNTTQCSDSFKYTRGLPEGIVRDQVCASMLNADTCQGDSGGPLQVSLRSYNTEHPFLVALTSFGRGCGIGSSGVYQQVAAHIPWIESVVNETMDPVRCTEKYGAFRLRYSLEPECSLRGLTASRVRLLWPEDAKEAEQFCSGTLIDYNTVLTSAGCTKNAQGVQPTEIEILENRVKIVEIHVHPEFRSPHNNLALLRLEKYLNLTKEIAPSCLPVEQKSEVCSDRQTHDPVACWDKFAETTKLNLLNKPCVLHRIRSSTVKLIWKDPDPLKQSCVGMVIKPDTVITSIRCMNLHGELPPMEVAFNESEVEKRVKILRTLKHPGNKEGSRNRDTALLVLAEPLEALVPSCIKSLVGERSNRTLVPVYKQGTTHGILALPVSKICNGSMLHSFKELVGETIANSSQYTCWDTDRHLVPGTIPVVRGAGLLDNTNRFIHGLTTDFSGFGSVDPLVSINLTSYTDWITRFVLYRPPKVELVFRAGDDEFDYGSKCTLKNGTAGNCMPEYSCERTINESKSVKDITICGFEGSVSYVCCPLGHQDFLPIPEIEYPSPVRLLPTLPYENFPLELDPLVTE